MDLKWIRKHPNELDQMLVNRGHDISAHKLLDQDKKHREILTQLQQLQSEKNNIDDQIAANKSQNLECHELLAQAAELKIQQELLAKKAADDKKELGEHLVWLPNLLDESVPIGNSEDDNIEIHRVGTPKINAWRKCHEDIANNINGINFEQAAKVSGARFVYLMGDLAKLERALSSWMLDTHTEEFGFTEIATPYLVREHAMFAAGQLPKFREDLFATIDGRFLIPTSEVTLVNWAQEKTFSLKDLPMCLTALSPCFRLEAGSAGRDTRGMMRQHQFNKVELVVLCGLEEAKQQHERLTKQAETLVERLELPYRRMLLCSKDTGDAATKTYDIEVWIPSENRYRELASSSNCGTYQSRRLSAKVINAEGKNEFICTLNCSGLPTGRTLIALLENHQQEDGSVLIPSVLHPYMSGKTVLRRANELR